MILVYWLYFVNFPCPTSPGPPPAESSSELSDLEQLQLLIDYLLALLSTDYISTAIPIKPSTVLYYLFGVSTTASGSSSKKRLLLHDGWLEMWAIILLLSSDVERNPGPRQITGKFTFMYDYNTIPHMLLLYFAFCYNIQMHSFPKLTTEFLVCRPACIIIS